MPFILKYFFGGKSASYCGIRRHLIGFSREEVPVTDLKWAEVNWKDDVICEDY